MKFSEWLLEYSLHIYVSFGMVLTWLVQMRLGKKMKKTWKDRAVESFICSFFTASVSLPLLDHYPELPHSIALLIGGFVGCIGFNGWQSLSNTVFGIITARFGVNQPMDLRTEQGEKINEDSYNVSPQRRNKPAQGEPPMPQRRD